MGQRHQTYIKVQNLNSKKENDKLSFGTNDTTILAYHNQWLYGRSPLYECAKVLKFCGNEETYNKTIYDTLGARDTRELSEALKWLLQINQEYSGGVKGVGYHWYCLLNDESPAYMNEIDRGDNNDGITIIDAINKKYCFMAFCGLECDDTQRAKIKNYKPLSAEQYVLAYYPDKKANWLDPPKDLSEQIDHAISMLKDYAVLTMDELHDMFPLQVQFKIKKTTKV